MGGGSVGDNLVLLHLLTDAHDRLLVQAGALVQAVELAQDIVAVVHLHALGIHVGDGAGPFRSDHHAAVAGHVHLQTGGDDRRLGNQQRHRLALHVRAHQRAVGVVVLEERDQPGRNAHHLLG